MNNQDFIYSSFGSLLSPAILASQNNQIRQNLKIYVEAFNCEVLEFSKMQKSLPAGLFRESTDNNLLKKSDSLIKLKNVTQYLDYAKSSLNPTKSAKSTAYLTFLACLIKKTVRDDLESSPILPATIQQEIVKKYQDDKGDAGSTLEENHKLIQEQLAKVPKDKIEILLSVLDCFIVALDENLGSPEKETTKMGFNALSVVSGPALFNAIDPREATKCNNIARTILMMNNQYLFDCLDPSIEGAILPSASLPTDSFSSQSSEEENEYGYIDDVCLDNSNNHKTKNNKAYDGDKSDSAPPPLPLRPLVQRRLASLSLDPLPPIVPKRKSATSDNKNDFAKQLQEVDEPTKSKNPNHLYI